MDEFDERDEWQNKNLYSTPDEIDLRQCAELLELLAEWRSGELPICDVAATLENTMGVIAGFTVTYRIAKKYGDPETSRSGYRKEGPTDAESLRGLMRPEVLAGNTKIIEALDQIKTLIEAHTKAIVDESEDAFDSWAAASAMAEVMLGSDESKTSLREFFSSMRYNKERIKSKNIPPQKSLDLFRPKTEKEVTASLAYKYAYRRAEGAAYAEWKKAHPDGEVDYSIEDPDTMVLDKSTFDEILSDEISAEDGYHDTSAAGDKATLEDIAEDAGLSDKNPIDDSDFFKDLFSERREYFYFDGTGAPEEGDEDIPFEPPIDYPERKLCAEIEIVPSGTGLIELFERDISHEWCEEPFARITTYSIAFVPKTPEDLEDLTRVLKGALKLLAEEDYKYHLIDYTKMGGVYKRVSVEKSYGGYAEATTSAFIDTSQGKAMVKARLDLDDLMILYYLMQRSIEPSAQIAAAMNAARYAEERGSPMPAADFADDFSGEHDISDFGKLRKGDAEDTIIYALKDAVTDLALNNINEVEFLARLSTLADHTLSGRLSDPYGVFPTYTSLLENKSSEESSGTNLTYAKAVTDRTKSLMRFVTGLGEDDPRSPAEALKYMIGAIREPLREHFREKAKTHRLAQIDWLNKYLAQRRADYERLRQQGRDPLQEMMEIFDQRNFDQAYAQKLSDLFAKRSGLTDEQRAEAKKTALALRSNLVIADSAVEPCIDGFHYKGWYQSKTKGSPFVRYELPEALKPFAPQDRPSPLTMLTMGDTSSKTSSQPSPTT